MSIQTMHPAIELSELEMVYVSGGDDGQASALAATGAFAGGLAWAGTGAALGTVALAPALACGAIIGVTGYLVGQAASEGYQAAVAVWNLWW